MISSSTTRLAKYNGTDGAYGFEVIGDISYRAKDNELMIEIPLELLGVTDYRQIDLEFKWADSTSAINTMEQFYTDGDCMPLGRMNYVYQTYIPGESVFEDLPSEKETSENTENSDVTNGQEPSGTQEGTNEGQTSAHDDKGCSSALSLVYPLLLLAGGAWIMKKKD